MLLYANTTQHRHRQPEGAGEMQDRRQGAHRRDPQPLRRIRCLPHRRRRDGSSRRPTGTGGMPPDAHHHEPPDVPPTLRPEAPPDAADSLEGGREGDECHPPGRVPQGGQRIDGRCAMEEKMIPAQADSRLTEVLSSLHRAYELFNRWEESSSESQFYDENIETVETVSEGFGLLESGLARLIADKMLFDLEMEYRQLQ